MGETTVSDGLLFRVTKNNILEMLPEQKEQLKKYMEDHKISIKEEKDVLKLNQVLENVYPKV